MFIRSCQGNTINNNNNNNNNSNVDFSRTDIMIATSMSILGRIDSFYLYYTNISDVTNNGPLYINYNISGNQLFSHLLISTRLNSDIPMSAIHYYELNKSNKCCYMSTYWIEKWGQTGYEDTRHQLLYLNIIDGNGNKLFGENDTLILTLDWSAYYVNQSASVHQLNIGNSDDTGIFYFGLIYFGYRYVYVDTLSINMNDETNPILTILNKIELINVGDIPKMALDFGDFENIYVESQLKFDENIIFLMYQVLLLPNNPYDSARNIGDFVQSWKVSSTSLLSVSNDDSKNDSIKQ